MEKTSNLPDNAHNVASHAVSTQSEPDPTGNYSEYLECDGKGTIDEDGFHASLHVHQFTPEEISVKTVDNSIVIEAKHEAQSDQYGHGAHQLTRRYDLPKGFHLDHVEPELSSYGILNIKATPVHDEVLEDKGERDTTGSK